MKHRQIHRYGKTWLLVTMTSVLLLMASSAQATCVEGAVATTPTSDFEIHDDGTVTHIPTGLMWKRCLEGRELNTAGDDCAGAATSFRWGEALQHAQDHAHFAGHSDWRVPNIQELQSIVEFCVDGVALNDEVFPSPEDGYLWSSTPFLFKDDATRSRIVDFKTGQSTAMLRGHSGGLLRLVRGGL